MYFEHIHLSAPLKLLPVLQYLSNVISSYFFICNLLSLVSIIYLCMNTGTSTGMGEGSLGQAIALKKTDPLFSSSIHGQLLLARGGASCWSADWIVLV